MSPSARASFLFYDESLISSDLHKLKRKITWKRETKTYTKKWKTRLNPISGWSSHFQCKYWLFIGKNPTYRIPGRLGEQTLPLTPQPSRGNAALAAFAAFPRPGCGQVATPYWWVSPGFPSAFIFSWFSRLSSGFWRNGLWSLLQPIDSEKILLNGFSTSWFFPDLLSAN